MASREFHAHTLETCSDRDKWQTLKAHLEEAEPRAGKALAFAIAGHHTGLANLAEASAGLPRPLTRRLEENRPVLDEILPSVPEQIADPHLATPRTGVKRYRPVVEVPRPFRLHLPAQWLAAGPGPEGRPV